MIDSKYVLSFAEQAANEFWESLPMDEILDRAFFTNLFKYAATWALNKEREIEVERQKILHGVINEI